MFCPAGPKPLTDFLLIHLQSLFEKNCLCLQIINNFVNTSVECSPFFETQSAKPRGVNDGDAMIYDVTLNQVVLAGKYFLNNLVKVLIHFRLDKNTCVAIVSKRFFHVSIYED